MSKDVFKLGDKEFTSRFILGSGKYSMELIKAAVENAGAEIITLAVRRTNTKKNENILDYIPNRLVILIFGLIETVGCVFGNKLNLCHISCPP